MSAGVSLGGSSCDISDRWNTDDEDRYSELIHVLYSKNTFFFHKPHHLAYFTQFMLPQRVQSLTSVDVVYPCAELLHPDDAVICAQLYALQKSYVSACETLSRLPHLVHIRISVPSPGLRDGDDSSSYYAGGVQTALEHLYLQPMDALVRARRGSLSTAELSMPESYFAAVDARGAQVLDVLAPRLGPNPDWYRWQRFLRRVDGGGAYWIHSRPDGALVRPACILKKR